jgi:hypothetical protein
LAAPEPPPGTAPNQRTDRKRLPSRIAVNGQVRLKEPRLNDNIAVDENNQLTGRFPQRGVPGAGWALAGFQEHVFHGHRAAVPHGGYHVPGAVGGRIVRDYDL